MLNMKIAKRPLVMLLAVLFCVSVVVGYGRIVLEPRNASAEPVLADNDQAIQQNAAAMLAQGREIFRNDTFGDEAFWTGDLRLNQAIEGAALGGVGPGVSPKTALAVGLKVDVDRLPPGTIAND
jgi:hypothetical protein